MSKQCGDNDDDGDDVYVHDNVTFNNIVDKRTNITVHNNSLTIHKHDRNTSTYRYISANMV